MTLYPRTAMMNKGQVQQCGKPDQTHVRPANLFVAGFFGSPPMNLIQPEDPLTALEGALIGLRPEQFHFGLPPEDIALHATITPV